jgi:hypothetical protein
LKDLCAFFSPEVVELGNTVLCFAAVLAVAGVIPGPDG